jgi:hypothetical protein
MVATARLPGIQFEVVAPPANETLVRMDIAAFVGFAASGPLHLPVAVEDIAHFEEIFGGDLALAADPKANEPVYAYLAPAVRAFFRNGGRRCWVVRVADEKSAESGRFPLPGLFRLQAGGLTQAFLPARSPGSWSDTLFASLALRSHPVVVTSFSAGLNSAGLALSTQEEVAPGDLLRFSIPGSQDVFWLFVDSAGSDTHSPLSSARGRLVAVTGSQSYWQQLSSPLSPGMLPVCERITMDLFVQSDDGQTWSLTDLGFAPSHPRYCGNLPDDAALYAMDTPTGLAAEAAFPRFPLAGRVHDDTAPASFFIPAGVGVVAASPLAAEENIPGFFPATRPLHSDAAELERNGLKSFNFALFLDAPLVGVSARDLLTEAFYIEFQSPSPRALRGIHSVIDLQEVTLISAPDAVQRKWALVDQQEIPDPSLSSPLQHPEWWHFADCRQQKEFPRVSEPPAGEFQPCDLQIVPAPGLTLTELGGGSYELHWLPMSGALDSLEEAVDPAFLTAQVKRQTTVGSVTIFGQPPGDYYYRLRRLIGAVSSDYSNGVAIRIQTAAGFQQESIVTYQDHDLLAVQQALVTMSAARGDLLAVLSLPEHYRERDTVAHATQLKSLLADQPGSLSFCAVYHPWLIGREENDLANLRTTPPEGAMAGVMAMRSAARGPWISPANEKLRGVVALSPVIRRNFWQLIQDSQVNLVRQEPGGFICLSAVTLSDDEDLLPINVRRLLSFLRKTALLVGNEYVFEPLSDQFRRGIERGFERLLEDLHHRGAFAGSTAAQAWQVSTSGGLNTPAAADLGRFYVELKVAPSLPLRFLTVRLVQTADRMFVTEGG